MKITMLGNSGSGKTTFLAGVYATFMMKDFSGFTIYPHRYDLQSQQIENHGFSQYYKTLSSKNWLKATSSTELYSLDLYYQSERVANFNWIDYSGSLLDNPETDFSKASDVFANIASSDAVILFVDAQKLTMTDDLKEAALVSGADALMRVLSGFSVNYPQTKLTFLIALSKCDAVENRWKGIDKNYQPLIEYGIKVFQPMMNVFKKEVLWRGGIMAVSTMGEGTVDINGNIINPLKPLNVEHVISFCISGTLRHEQNDTLRNFIKRNENIEVISQKYSGFLGALRRTYSFFHKGSNELDILKQLHQEQMKDIDTLNKIRQPIERLESLAMKKIRIIT